MQLESGLEGEGRMECGGVAGRKRKARVQRRKGILCRGERERERGRFVLKVLLLSTAFCIFGFPEQSLFSYPSLDP